jgi:hypothetical protein
LNLGKYDTLKTSLRSLTAYPSSHGGRTDWQPSPGEDGNAFIPQIGKENNLERLRLFLFIKAASLFWSGT